MCAECDVYRGRPCGAQSTLSDLGVVSGSRLDIALRLRGGGGDGGATGAESRISYLEMYASKKPDKVGLKNFSPFVSCSSRLSRLLELEAHQASLSDPLVACWR